MLPFNFFKNIYYLDTNNSLYTIINEQYFSFIRDPSGHHYHENTVFFLGNNKKTQNITQLISNISLYIMNNKNAYYIPTNMFNCPNNYYVILDFYINHKLLVYMMRLCTPIID